MSELAPTIEQNDSEQMNQSAERARALVQFEASALNDENMTDERIDVGRKAINEAYAVAEPKAEMPQVEVAASPVDETEAVISELTAEGEANEQNQTFAAQRAAEKDTAQEDALRRMSAEQAMSESGLDQNEVDQRLEKMGLK